MPPAWEPEATHAVPVTLIDTDQITAAAGLLVMMAAEAAQNGRSLAEIITLS